MLNDPVNMIDPAGLFGDMVQSSNPQAQSQVPQAERETGQEMSMTVRQMGRSGCFERCMAGLAINIVASESVFRGADSFAESVGGVCKAAAKKVIPMLNAASTAQSVSEASACARKCY